MLAVRLLQQTSIISPSIKIAVMFVHKSMILVSFAMVVSNAAAAAVAFDEAGIFVVRMYKVIACHHR